MNNKKKLVFFQERFFPAGTYNWTVPDGCTSVDAFCVGGGGTGGDGTGGGGGYTKTKKGISVTPGQIIQITVGAGGGNGMGGASIFGSVLIADGGRKGGNNSDGGGGGSGGGAPHAIGGTNGSNGQNDQCSSRYGGSGQGSTTRDFGESTGRRNAGGGNGEAVEGHNGDANSGGESDYTEGSGSDGNIYPGVRAAKGGGGYGGGGGAARGGSWTGGKGGDGTVLIRGYKYE